MTNGKRSEARAFVRANKEEWYSSVKTMIS